jgi:16S rRNA (guanine966-N2)-methyltransferase
MTTRTPRRGGASRPGAAAAGAGRVIAGSARGIRLLGPADRVRPLGDRLKQALFAILEPELRGRAFLDLFAGSGAAGIEALSRGATSATFVELDRASSEAIARNLEATHLAGPAAHVVRADVLAWLGGASPDAPFQVAFLDPPYDRPDLLAAALEGLASAGRGATVATSGLVVAKHPARSGQPDRIGLLASLRERRFGESALTFYRWSDGEAG